jgi:hypothetical protein
MLNYHCTGIPKYILDRICQIDDEIVNDDPQYRELGKQVDEWNAKLPPEDHQLLEDYEGGWMAQLCRQEELVF